MEQDLNIDVLQMLQRSDIQQLIEESRFEDLYEGFENGSLTTDGDSWAVSTRGSFTELLYEAGIDPLRYMNTIPNFFLFGSNIKHITIPSHVTKISHYAFCDCSSLTEITFPSSLEWIGENAFQNCTSLTEIVTPNSVRHIASSAFMGCDRLARLVLGANLEYLGNNVIEDTDLKTIICNFDTKRWREVAANVSDSIGTVWNRQLRRCKIICTDGTLTFNPDYMKWL